MLDRRTVAFPEYPGNRQFISNGNLAENAHAFLFLMDYANGRRLKLWGTATIVDRRELLDRLIAPDMIKAERAIVFAIHAIDWNCSSTFPSLFRERLQLVVAHAAFQRTNLTGVRRERIISEPRRQSATIRAGMPASV